MLSRVLLLAIPWTAPRLASLSFGICLSLLKLMSTESVMPTNHLILYRPLLLLPSIFPSIRVFSNELALHIRWPKYWNFSFSISPSNTYSELISFKIDWFDLPERSNGLSRVFSSTTCSKPTILWRSAFFMVQLSHPYMTSGKTIPLAIRTFVGKAIVCFLICCLVLSWLLFLWTSIF